LSCTFDRDKGHGTFDIAEGLDCQISRDPCLLYLSNNPLPDETSPLYTAVSSVGKAKLRARGAVSEGIAVAMVDHGRE
jgi:hypothetical protein